MPGSHQGIIKTAFPTLLDADTVLRDIDAAAISSSTSETAITTVNPRSDGVLKVRVIAPAYGSYSAGSAYWSVKLEVSDVAGGSFTAVTPDVEIDGDNGADFLLTFDQTLAEYLDDDCAVLRVTATKTSTPDDLSYGAYVVC